MEKSTQYFVTKENVLVFHTNYKAMETVFEVYGVEDNVRVGTSRFGQPMVFGNIELLSTFGVQKRLLLRNKYKYSRIEGCIRIFEK